MRMHKMHVSFHLLYSCSYYYAGLLINPETFWVACKLFSWSQKWGTAFLAVHLSLLISTPPSSESCRRQQLSEGTEISTGVMVSGLCHHSSCETVGHIHWCRFLWVWHAGWWKRTANGGDSVEKVFCCWELAITKCYALCICRIFQGNRRHYFQSNLNHLVRTWCKDNSQSGVTLSDWSSRLQNSSFHLGISVASCYRGAWNLLSSTYLQLTV